jgi:hypothetical protein
MRGVVIGRPFGLWDAMEVTVKPAAKPSPVAGAEKR